MLAQSVSASRSRTAHRWARSAAAGLLAAALATAPSTISALPGLRVPTAFAASCPDAEVVFARGRLEPPGVGLVGAAFISALRSKVNRDIGVYPVHYPADTEVDIGADDMSRHVQSMINNCPNTRLVLGGYSLGAAVTDMVIAVPYRMLGFHNPLPPGDDTHIAAIALFGNGSQWVGPITNFNPVYNDRTIDLCHGADPVCNPADANSWAANWPQHDANAYITSGLVDQAADFVAGKLR
ncbi:MAG: cutinase family protein [Mycobacterium sp.]|uniref:cutinase family protein n=1 Tax=Mycobacterium sp. TaxID=1785 RepID=UPI002620A51E|nr:cutinase family protein [Mycobacterium sp.]MDI3314693.1 cutinase family protein [Mycobacterium sp.]